jgi:serine protease AprX
MAELCCIGYLVRIRDYSYTSRVESHLYSKGVTKMRRAISPCMVSILIYMLVLAFSATAVINDDSVVPPNRAKNLMEAMERAGQNEKIPVIVTFTKALSEADYAMLDRVVGFRPKHKYSIINGASGALTKGQINALSRIDVVERIKIDKTLELCLYSSTYWFGADDAIKDFPGYDGSGVTIAVMDSGIDEAHVDLSGKVVGWMDYVNGLPDPYDDHGHGTHCASICAGTGTGNGSYRGVAPGAFLIGIKVFNNVTREAFESNVMAGLDWIVNLGGNPSPRADIITMSIGRRPDPGELLGDDELLAVACNNAVNTVFNAGKCLVIVVAAGNEGPAERTIRTPGVASTVITVGAMADVGEGGFNQTQWSSRGPAGGPNEPEIIKPDISAPGYYITAADADDDIHDGYIAMSGTSMSTPFVAGIAALMLQADPGLTHFGVKYILMSTAIDWGSPGVDIDFGAGRLDGYLAVKRAHGDLTDDTEPLVPNHFYAEETIAQRRNADEWSINIDNTAYPIAVSLITPDWVARNPARGDPNFDLVLYDPNHNAVASYAGGQRQDTLSYQPTTVGNYTLQVKSSLGSGPYFFDLSAGASAVTLPNDKDDDPSIASGSISGTVTDASTGSPIANSTVSASPGGYNTTTETDGTYSLADLPVGTYTVTASATGYIEQSKLGDVLAEEITDLDFTLTPAPPPTDTMYVESIAFSVKVAGPNQFLYTTVKVLDGADDTPLAAVRVAMTLEWGEGNNGTIDGLWDFAGDTGSDGTIKFTLSKAQNGHYIATVTGLTFGDYGWDEIKGVISAKCALDNGVITYITEGGALASDLASFRLFASHPNPCNPDTWIPFGLGEDRNVVIRIYDVAGRIIKILDLGYKPAGFYTTKEKAAYWDGKNEAGEPVSSGIYFYTIQAGNFTATKKMIVAK